MVTGECDRRSPSNEHVAGTRQTDSVQPEVDALIVPAILCCLGLCQQCDSEPQTRKGKESTICILLARNGRRSSLAVGQGFTLFHAISVRFHFGWEVERFGFRDERNHLALKVWGAVTPPNTAPALPH